MPEVETITNKLNGKNKPLGKRERGYVKFLVPSIQAKLLLDFYLLTQE